MPADADPLLDGRLVLLVDDDPTVLEVCRSYLEQAGFRVHEAADAFTALDCGRPGTPRPGGARPHAAGHRRDRGVPPHPRRLASCR